MCDRPELVGVLHYVEFDLEITFTGKPVFIFSREKELIAFRLQETIENISARLISNKASFEFKKDLINRICAGLKEQVETK